jgi:hypothetical protein
MLAVTAGAIVPLATRGRESGGRAEREQRYG